MFKVQRITKWSLLFLSLLLLSLKSNAYTIKSFVGTIQFPLNVKNLPQMPTISYEGQQITITECDNITNKICYEVPLSRKYQKEIYFLFTENENLTISLKNNDELTINNTIDHLTLKQDAQYRIFRTTINNTFDRATKKTTVDWIIKEMALPDNKQIPDSTLIFPIPSNYIKELTGGDAMQLPTITIKDDVQLLAGGSEEDMHNIALKEVVASIDLNGLHTKATKTTKQVGPSTLIIPTI